MVTVHQRLPSRDWHQNNERECQDSFQTEADRDAIRNVNHHAFGGNAEAKLVDALRDDGSAAVSLVAEVDGEVVDHIIFSVVTINTDKLAIESLSLAPMAVLPRFQRQGIGSSLIETGIEERRKLSYKSVVVHGHPAFHPDQAPRLTSPPV